MISPELINKIPTIVKNLNTRQKIVAHEIISSNDLIIVEYKNEICVKTKQGEIYDFVKYLKSKCNC